MPTSELAQPSHPQWLHAGRHLWLGTAGDHDVAVIEKDGRYAAIDGSGHVRGVFPSVLQAQLALA